MAVPALDSNNADPMKQRIDQSQRGKTVARAVATGMFLLLLASIGKFLDLGEFAATLKDWGVGSPFLRGLLAAAIPSVELALPLCWFAGIYRLAAARTACMLVILFTVVYIAVYTLYKPVPCGCLGRLFEHVPFTDTFTFAICRNLLMIGCLAPSFRVYGSFINVLAKQGNPG
jgi:hypothetical protein